jgi:predicted protein tyrosine phosphatase
MSTSENRPTKTAQIFSDLCPYDNSSQTKAKRLLFVCSVGMLRSPTAQMVASSQGYNARAAGSNVKIALIPLSCNLINWAHHIIFMNAENAIEAHREFEAIGYKEDILEKQIVWNFEDLYNWGDNVLWNAIDWKLKDLERHDFKLIS